MRLIDSDELLKKYPFNKDTSETRTDFEYGFNSAVDAAVIEIEDMPTIDAVPVTHAHWIKRSNPAYSPFDGTSPDIFICSHCGQMERIEYDYCHCGARMDEEENDNG